ncbi:hypothetical protein [Mycobacterium sp. NPDC050853]|nr:hypothetical protein [Mycobacteroides sp. LB1]
MSSPGDFNPINQVSTERPDVMNSRREAATLIVGALMLFGAAATVAEAQERAHERATTSVSEPALAPSTTHPGL